MVHLNSGPSHTIVLLGFQRVCVYVRLFTPSKMPRHRRFSPSHGRRQFIHGQNTTTCTACLLLANFLSPFSRAHSAFREVAAKHLLQPQQLTSRGRPSFAPPYLISEARCRDGQSFVRHNHVVTKPVLLGSPDALLDTRPA